MSPWTAAQSCSSLVHAMAGACWLCWEVFKVNDSFTVEHSVILLMSGTLHQLSSGVLNESSI